MDASSVYGNMHARAAGDYLPTVVIYSCKWFIKLSRRLKVDAYGLGDLKVKFEFD
jgi:hypothetical protein